MRAALLSLALCSTACSDGCNCRKQKPTTQSDAAPDEGRVEVTATGREPRVKLEVARWNGLSYRVFLTTEVSLAAQGQTPLRMPTAYAEFRITTVRGMADPIVWIRGGRELRLVEERGRLEKFEVTSPELPPEMLNKLNEPLKALVGTTTRQLVAEDGEIAEVKTELIGGVQPTPEQKSKLDATWDLQRRFPFRLPREAIGPGSRWRFSAPLEFHGVRAIQVADMTLVSLDDHTARIRMGLRHQAPRQELPNPMDPRQFVTLEHYRGDGDGDVTMDRATAVTLDARLAMTATLRMITQVGGAPQTVVLVAATVTRMKSELVSADAGSGPPASGSGSPPGSDSPAGGHPAK